MNLNNLSETIEREIHVIHDISQETYNRIFNIINEDTSVKDPIDINDEKTILITKLKPFSYKLLRYLIARLSNITEKTLQHIISVILVKAFKFFPVNTDIYLIYCIKRIDKDKDGFVKECLRDVINKMDNEKKIYLNMLLCFISFVVIIGSLCFINKVNEKRREVEKKKKILSSR